MKCNKWVHWARLADNHLQDILHLSVAAFDANVEELSSGKQAQVLHWMTIAPEQLKYNVFCVNNSILQYRVFYKQFLYFCNS